MKSIPRGLILGLAVAMAPIGTLLTAPPAQADCTSSGYATVCAQGEVRGADGVPRAATPVVPYPCEYDWYCGTDVDIDIGWDPGPGIGGGPVLPGRPGGPGPR